MEIYNEMVRYNSILFKLLDMSICSSYFILNKVVHRNQSDIDILNLS